MNYRIFLKTWVCALTLSFSSQAPANDNYAFLYQILPLTPNQQAQMKKYTWSPTCPVPLTDLVEVQLKYWNFQQKPQQGTLIVNKQIAREVVDIFRTLYYQHYPIQNMETMESFQGNDAKSMAANNTSAFNCRKMSSDPQKFSQHSYGTAIDINPWQNPYISGNHVSPPEGIAYVNREYLSQGMIGPQSEIYKVFKAKGWAWGGDWTDPKDYQHFEKFPQHTSP